jgi:hypothetical protein
MQVRPQCDLAVFGRFSSTAYAVYKPHEDKASTTYQELTIRLCRTEMPIEPCCSPVVFSVSDNLKFDG